MKHRVAWRGRQSALGKTGHDLLRRQLVQHRHEPTQRPIVQLRRRIVHQQHTTVPPVRGEDSDLGQYQPGRDQFLLTAGDFLTDPPGVETDQ